jgi:hypothetical protein
MMKKAEVEVKVEGGEKNVGGWTHKVGGGKV